jgi:acyl-CoA synthetase (AMP-forming)/AMP-acid ligase II
MYPGKHAHLRPLQPAFIMASTGEAVAYRELDARSNRLAHLFRRRGLKRLDHYSIFMENLAGCRLAAPATRTPMTMLPVVGQKICGGNFEESC